MIMVFAIGMAVILMFISNLYAFIVGSLIITFGNFSILQMKYKRCLSERTKIRSIQCIKFFKQWL